MNTTLTRLLRSLRGRMLLLLRATIRTAVLDIVNSEIRVYGDRGRLLLSPSAVMVNTLFNTSSGRIEVGDYTFTGHNVSIITGTHRHELLLERRLRDIPHEGRDVIIGKGVWIGSNAIILGPCSLGDHSVVAAGAVVLPGTEVLPYSIVAGVPARCVKTIDNTERDQPRGCDK